MPRYVKSLKIAIITACCTIISIHASAEQTGDLRYRPSKANLKAREWFQDAKFGLFFVWGVNSIPGKGEWVMYTDKMSIEEYDKLPPQFNPVNYDPDDICRMAVDAGMKYITVTTRHHDGFAIFDSRVTDWDIADRTPYGRDALKMLADACERHGLKLFMYYSHLDWHHPDYYPRGKTDYDNGRPESGNWNKYIGYMMGQLNELCTNYGRIGGVWFDGMWDQPDADWQLGKQYSLIHHLQPQALIGNNHHRAPFPGEDFQMFEKGLPGNDPFSTDNTISALPLETCDTINSSWGYNENDRDFKSVRELIHYLVKAAGNNSNFLLDVGPKPDGSVQVEFRESLAAMGKWIRTNGESIYGTRGGPVPPQSWGVCTRKKDTVFLHVLDDSAYIIAVPDLGGKIAEATLLDGTVIEYETTGIGTIFKLPEQGRDKYDTVVVVKLSR